MRWGAVIAAGGRGERFGAPKQLVEIAGLPMLAWSIRAFAEMREIDEIAIAIDAALVAEAQELLVLYTADRPSSVVVGGQTRQESVQRGVAALADRVEAVLIHDGARPLVRAQNVRAGMRAVRPGRAAVLAAQVVDTIKEVDPKLLRVERTLDRSKLWAAQTPQFAMLSDLRKAYVHADVMTDDTALLERAGIEVVVVPSRHANFKITVPEDVEPAEIILRRRFEHGDADAGALLVEVFAGAEQIDAICRAVEAHGGRVDAVERELPRGGVVRAYIRAEQLHDFESSFASLADGSATITVHDVGGVA